MAAPLNPNDLISRMEKWKVIPDVVDRFEPGGEDLKVVYGSTAILTGGGLREEGVQELPKVEWGGSVAGDALYTLFMVDPDAPKPEEPTFREFVHWIVANIPGSYSATCQKFLGVSTEVLPYTGPAPVEGNHRYVFVLFKQTGKVELTAPSERKNFNVRAFAKQNDLGSPVFCDFFFVEPAKNIIGRA